MSAKSLQKASIINITASKIRIKHPDLSKNPSTILADGVSASGASLTVLDNNGFEDNDYMIIGTIGDNQTEAIDVNGVVTRGTSIPITNTLKFPHRLNDKVTKIYERQIKIYGSATYDGHLGASLITTVDIDWNKEYTEYSLSTTDTAYAYYYVLYCDGTTDGDNSDYVVSTGLESATVYNVIEQALDIVGLDDFSEKITLKKCIKYTNDCQLAISQYVYQNPRTAKFIPIDWGHEVTEDKTISIVENKNRYDISGLNFKYNASRSIISVRIGDKGQIDKINPVEMDEELVDKAYTELSAQAVIGATTLTVDSNVEYADSGSIYIGSDIVTYTGKSGTTGFTGIPASGTGSITAIHVIGSPVWQNIVPAKPTKWTVFDGYLIFNCPPDGGYADYEIKIKLYKKLTSLTEASDSIAIPFYNVFQYYIASRIEQRRGNLENSLLLMGQFDKMILANSQFRDVIPKAKKVYKQYSI